MKTDSWSVSGVAASVLLVSALWLPCSARANDYYSWIDANGTMVMTDDPGRVPSSASRSQIQVHRFEPVPPGPPVRHDPEPVSRDEPSQTPAMDSRDLSLPLVLLDEPEHPVRAQYVWVPLLSPLFVGGNSVSGFWWHPGATSPVEAFKQYLAQHYREQRNQWVSGVGAPYPPYYPGSARGASGNVAYDQVTRERQALEESIRLRHFPNSPAPGQHGPRGGGSHSIRSR
jgi:Domain of unknown function (DUF4124)